LAEGGCSREPDALDYAGGRKNVPANAPCRLSLARPKSSSFAPGDDLRLAPEAAPEWKIVLVE
jgi:hypothetical protein